MPPVRIRHRERAKKGTLKRLMKELVKRYPFQLIVSAICIVFNIFANVSSSIFMSLVTNAVSTGIIEKRNPLVDTLPVKSSSWKMERSMRLVNMMIY